MMGRPEFRLRVLADFFLPTEKQQSRQLKVKSEKLKGAHRRAAEPPV